MTSNQKLIQQGAEAKIFKIKNKVIKNRIKKSYRISKLDNKIRKLRTRSEAKLLEKASKVIPIPKITNSNEDKKIIKMEFIDGDKLSDKLDKYPIAKQRTTCRKIGTNIAKLHDINIIHGDLTTSNMILKNNKIYFIDFGLGYISHKFEDKAVDLHLLKQSLEAKHFQHYKELIKEILIGYSKSKDFKIVLERLKAVEKRGRYKH